MKIIFHTIGAITLLLSLSQTNFTHAEQNNWSTTEIEKNPIFISEIHPNPEGKDQNKEWIEIYNSSENFINIKSWKIKSGKSEFEVKTNFQLKPNNYTILDSNIIEKISLKNSENQIELIDNQNRLIHQVKYEKSTEGQSFSNIEILKSNQKKNIWMWTEATKSFQNPILYELEGTIIQSPIINKEFYFRLKNQNGEIITILFDNEKYDFEYMKNLLSTNQNIKVLSEKFQENIYLLQEFQLQNPNLSTSPRPNYQKSQKWLYWMLIPITFLTLLLILTNNSKENSFFYKPP